MIPKGRGKTAYSTTMLALRLFIYINFFFLITSTAIVSLVSLSQRLLTSIFIDSFYLFFWPLYKLNHQVCTALVLVSFVDHCVCQSHCFWYERWQFIFIATQYSIIWIYHNSLILPWKNIEIVSVLGYSV